MTAEIDFYIGTYTNTGRSKGIYRSTLDTDAGSLSTPELVYKISKPSFLAIHPNGKFIYSITEGDPGIITALKIDLISKTLSFINHSFSGGLGPCHLTVSDNGRVLFVANYVSGSVASLPISEDGSLGEAVSIIQHSGRGPKVGRQEGPHVHSVNLSPDNRFAYVADLGIDCVMIYRVNSSSGEMEQDEAGCFKGRPGSGPRHLTFHMNGRFVYLINELDNTVTVLLQNSESGGLVEVQTVSTLPEGCNVESKAAEIKVHPNGRFLYGSNRGYDSLVIYKINQDTGCLKLIGFQNANIDEPRHFNLDPTGHWCIVGNQDRNAIMLFEVDSASGLLTPAGSEKSVGQPICIKFHY